MRAPILALFACIAPLVAQQPAGLAWLDLEGDTARQVTVHRVSGRYQGHPTTVLLPDGKTMLCVHPEGHGKGAIVLQRSEDGGLSWSEPLPVPDNWSTSLETPTIHRFVGRDGSARLAVFSGMYPIRSSISTDDGLTWTSLAPIGGFGGIVAMASVVALKNGDYAAFFHDDGRYLHASGKVGPFAVYQTRSRDAGLTWSEPKVVWSGADVNLCEPGVVRSPDGKRLAMLLRENSRKKRSHVCFSDDESATWSKPVELPASLTGDRHVGAYAPDGRLLVSFRDMANGSPTYGDWVAWVGTFDDLVKGREGQYRVRLSRNWHETDCGYPGVEVLPDGTFVLVSYGHWVSGQSPFVRAVRLRLAELDELAKGSAPTFARESSAVLPTARAEEWWQRRVAADLEKVRAGGIRTVMLGDSITQGWDAAGRDQWRTSWVQRQAVNLGVSGDRTQNVLWRLDNGLLEALASEPNDVRAIVLMIGTNNSNGEDNTAEEIANGIGAIVARLRKGLPKARILLLSIFPRGEKPDLQRAKCVMASALAATALGKDEKVVCRDIGKAFVEADGSIKRAVMPDFLHLSADAYGIWAKAIVDDVDRMLAEAK